MAVLRGVVVHHARAAAARPVDLRAPRRAARRRLARDGVVEAEVGLARRGERRVVEDDARRAVRALEVVLEGRVRVLERSALSLGRGREMAWARTFGFVQLNALALRFAAGKTSSPPPFPSSCASSSSIARLPSSEFKRAWSSSLAAREMRLGVRGSPVLPSPSTTP